MYSFLSLQSFTHSFVAELKRPPGTVRPCQGCGDRDGKEKLPSLDSSPHSEGKQTNRSCQSRTGTKSEGNMEPGRHREGKGGFPEEVAVFCFAFYLIVTMAGFKWSLTGRAGVSQMRRREGAVSLGGASPDCIPHEHPWGPGWQAAPLHRRPD